MPYKYYQDHKDLDVREYAENLGVRYTTLTNQRGRSVNIRKKQAYRLVFEYLETFYNTKRIHSHCDYMSPNDFEKLYEKSQDEHLLFTCTKS